ncbi:MAG: DNA methyltransferase [Flavobacteriaceae bacterium]
MKLYKILEEKLKQENNFISDDGELKKWVVINKAQNYDAELITLLLENDTLKEKFFIDVKGVLVFNQNLFVQFLEQKNYLNDSYTKYKNKVGLTIEGKYLKQLNEVALVWPFKDCVLEGGQSREEDKREEIFFNEILAQDEITQLLEPKVLTNAKTYDKEGEKEFIDFTRDAELNKKRGLPEDTITDNLIIKGNNLLALHSLKKEFTGKVKLIYIDPPYNTGNDGFKYNDSFNHSSWLTFMKNRLLIANKLLKDDGVIFVHCDYNEHAYLKVIMDEIFGKINFVNDIVFKTESPNGVKTTHACKKILKSKEHILVYKKHSIIFNPQYKALENYDIYYDLFIEGDLEKIESCRVIKLKDKLKEIGVEMDLKEKQFEEFVIKNSNRIFSSLYDKTKKSQDKKYYPSTNKIYPPNSHNSYFVYKNRICLFFEKKIKNVFGTKKPSILLGDLWDDIPINNLYIEGKVDFKNGKKSEFLLSRIIELASNKNDIILDYHLGSGTTNAVSLKSSRQFIGIEQLDYGDNDSVIRLNNVIQGEQSGVSKAYDWKGGGSFTYLELKKHNQTFIELIEDAHDSKTLLEIWEKMKAKSFLIYNVDIKKQEEHIEDFKALHLKEQKQHLIEILDKNQLYVNLSSLDDKDFSCSKKEKQVTRDFYQM